MNIKDIYTVSEVASKVTHEWLLNKHYSHRVPFIQYSYGLFRNKSLDGVMTFGHVPSRMLQEYWKDYRFMELNRLVVNEHDEPNVISFFIGKVLKLIPHPIVIVSYSDMNHGHHGYIYQATNWLYTGISPPQSYYIDKRSGERLHPRTVVTIFGSRLKESLPLHIEHHIEESCKHRYFMLLGSKGERNKMLKKLKSRYTILQYPKGKNDRYDASYEPKVSASLEEFF